MSLDIKKINVRSPYYINVVGEGVTDQPDYVLNETVDVIGTGTIENETIEEDIVTPPVTIAEPVSIKCGDTQNIGAEIGLQTYEISMKNRQLGDYTITFSNLKVPIRYKMGVKGNLPASFTTSDGWSTYKTEWKNATEEDLSFSDPSANPNGLTSTVTYTSTQSDIDTYGETIQLLVVMPIETLAYKFSVSCPAVQPQSVTNPDTVGNFVQFLTIYNDNVPVDKCTVQWNGDSSLISLPNKGAYKLYKTTTKDLFNQSNTSVYGTTAPNYPAYNLITDKNNLDVDDIILGRNIFYITYGANRAVGLTEIDDVSPDTLRGKLTLWWSHHELFEENSQIYAHSNAEQKFGFDGNASTIDISFYGEYVTIEAQLYTFKNVTDTADIGLRTSNMRILVNGYIGGQRVYHRNLIAPYRKF